MDIAFFLHEAAHAAIGQSLVRSVNIMRNPHLVWAVGIAMAISAADASATVINGGFESSFAGWSTIGNVSIQNSSVGSGPTEGVAQALLTTSIFFSPPASSADLENFFGVASGAISGVIGGGDVPFEGSGIQQTFNVNAGDTLSFDVNFLTDELAASPSASQNDTAFVVLNGLVLFSLADLSSTLFPSSTFFFDETGFLSSSITFGAPQSLTFGIGVVDANDRDFDSALLVDNIALQPLTVPEPSSLAMIGIGLLGAGIAYRRRQICLMSN